MPQSCRQSSFVSTDRNGFVLIELIATIILIGIIGIFTGFFLYTGVNGYLRAKETTEGAMRAQIALDRISLELRSVETVAGTPTENSITYTSRDPLLPGTRTLSYDDATDTISIDNGTTVNPLLDKVVGFAITLAEKDLNDTADSDEIAGIEVTFTVDEIERPFGTRLYPRVLIAVP